MLGYDALRAMVAEVGTLQGWDFSRVRDVREPMPWDYVTLVRGYLTPTDRVLDIGTGGGERFLELAPWFQAGLGVDLSPAMVAQAAANRRVEASANDSISEWTGDREREKARKRFDERAKPGVSGKAGGGVPDGVGGGLEIARGAAGVRFGVMDAARLGVGGGQFDVVLNRHADVVVAEVVRVLRPGGLFITQQVAARNTLNILAAFGWTPESFGPGWYQPVAELAADFEAAGCRVMAQGMYDVRYWFLDVPSLLFWLTAVPLPEPFELAHHWRGVNHILEAYTTPRGIETNEHRELLVVRKPGHPRMSVTL